jgi:hypothetical protein
MIFGMIVIRFLLIDASLRSHRSRYANQNLRRREFTPFYYLRDGSTHNSLSTRQRNPW